MTQESVSKQIAKLMPTGLSDIIRKNNHLVELLPTSIEDLKSIEMSLPTTNLRGTFESAFVYKFSSKPPNPSFFALVGHMLEDKGISVHHTSVLVGFDPETNAFLTKSGSHYIVQRFIEPDNQDLLVHICCWLNKSASGRFFGVPEWFY